MRNSVIRRKYFSIMEIDGLLDKLQTLVTNEPEGVHLLKGLVNRYKQNWIVYKDTEIMPWTEEPADEQPDEAVVIQWADRFRFIYITTKDRYIKLINIYKENEAKLLDKIESASTTKFNDTPQNANVGDSDEYTSTVSKVSTSVDPGELMDRLNNIHNKLKDLDKEWMDEFDSLFGTSTLL